MTAAASASWAVKLRGLGKSYDAGWRGAKFQALQGVSLQLGRGQVLGLLGPNGSGKSTTLKLLAGLIEPTSGEAFIGGTRAGSVEARARIGYLPESPHFSAHLTGREFLDYCAGLSGMPATDASARIDAMLAWSGLGAAAGKRIGTYSKGMLQRLGLAQAVLHDPELVLLDEPSSGLDPEGRLGLTALIRSLAAQGKTVVFSSHLLSQAAELCDRLAILGRGRLLVEGPVDVLLGTRGEAPVEASPLEKLYLEKLRAHD